MFSWFRKMRRARHLELGRRGEVAAARFLRRKSWRIIERNYACPRGEIDLIADDRGTLVFVEVRTRGPGAYVSGERSVDKAKERRVAAAAEHYLRQWKRESVSRRFDIVSVEAGADGRIANVEHFPAAF